MTNFLFSFGHAIWRLFHVCYYVHPILISETGVNDYFSFPTHLKMNFILGYTLEMSSI